MNKRIACVQVLILCSVAVSSAADSSVAEGLERSPNDFIAGMTQAVRFEGCNSGADGEVCSLRVKLLESYAFTSPDFEKPPESFQLLAAPNVGEQPIKLRQCIVFAVPVGKTGVYGATYSVCDPTPAAVAQFKVELKQALVNRLSWMPELAP